MVKSLTSTQMNRAYRRALKKSAEILKRETDRLFADNTHLNKRKIEVTTRSGKLVKKADAGVATVRVYVGKKYKPYAKVDIMGDYMMKWFELGTKERKTKGWKILGQYKRRDDGKRWYNWRMGRGRRTGRIKPLYLFLRAQNMTEAEIFNAMENMTKKEILTTYRRACRKK